MLLTVAHELESGCALIPEWGAMYGNDNTSEARQAMAMARRIPVGSLVLADAGFGIFSVVYAMVQAGQSVLFRLSKQRFAAMLGQCEQLEQTDRGARYRLHWVPSPKARRNNSDLPADACLDVELHAVEEDGESLYLVTTLAVDSIQAAARYRRRYDVEHDIRDVKVTLEVEKIRAKSVEMVHKELPQLVRLPAPGAGGDSAVVCTFRCAPAADHG